MSYFHEYFLPDGRKTMRSFSEPFDLSKHGTKWFTDSEAVLDVIALLDDFKHHKVATPSQVKRFRRADKVEIKAGEIQEFKIRN